MSFGSSIRCLLLTQAAADGLETALGRLEEVDRTVYELEQGMATLRPQLAAAEEEVQQRMGLITTAKERLARNTTSTYIVVANMLIWLDPYLLPTL